MFRAPATAPLASEVRQARAITIACGYLLGPAMLGVWDHFFCEVGRNVVILYVLYMTLPAKPPI
jgi:hypothetical protein